MNKNSRFIGYLILIIIAVGVLWYILKPHQTSADLSGFAQCLTQKNVIMYGADSCPHCQNQKIMLGTAFKFINYVECRQNPNQCVSAGISSIPTWLFGDGEKLVGEQTLAGLSRKSGCALPEK